MFSRVSQSYPSLQFEDAEILCDLRDWVCLCYFQVKSFGTRQNVYYINEYVHTRIHAEIMDFLGLLYKNFQGFT